MMFSIVSIDEAPGMVICRSFQEKKLGSVFSTPPHPTHFHHRSRIMTTHVLEINTWNPILPTLPSFILTISPSPAPPLLRLLTLLTSYKSLSLCRPHDFPSTLLTRILTGNPSHSPAHPSRLRRPESPSPTPQKSWYPSRPDT